jgi:hypothetical protein
MSDPLLFVGIDVAKAELEVALCPSTDAWTISHDDPAGLPPSDLAPSAALSVPMLFGGRITTSCTVPPRAGFVLSRTLLAHVPELGILTR